MPAPSAIRKSLLRVALVAALLIAVAWWSGTREPEYHGQPLSVFLHSSAEPNFDGFPPSLEDMGPEAIRWLGWAAEHGQLPTKPAPSIGFKQNIQQSTAERIWTWCQNLFRKRFEKDYDERGHALWTLTTLGPRAEPAIPSLARIVAGPHAERVDLAARCLVSIGPAAVPAMQQAVRENNRWARFTVVKWVIEELLTAPRDWQVEFLVHALTTSPDEAIRRAAITGLTSQGAHHEVPSDSVTRAFIASLSDSNLDVRTIAARQMPWLGAKAIPAIPRLIEMLDESDKNLRLFTIATLGRIDRSEKRSLPRLRELSADPDPTIRDAGSTAVNNLERAASP